MEWDPRRPVRFSRKTLDRELFWMDVKLYAKVLAIVAIPFAMAIWALIYWMDRI